MFMKVVCVQVSLVQALVPRDEADEHSAILEVRAGGCRGGEATCRMIIQDEEGYLLPTIARKITCRRFD